MTDSKNGSAPAPNAQLSLRPHYSQDWPNYNRAQCEEKARFIELLADLCGTVPEPEYTFGRPRLPLADMVFACAYKVYSGFSSRRFTCDLQDAHDKGLLANVPHFNSVSNYMSNPDLTPTLDNLITLSSLPLKGVETDFAVDSSGFSTSTYISWFSNKWGRIKDHREWVKVSLMCGVSTNIVTSVEMSGWEAHDTNYFIPLIERTAEHFVINEVSADKAYLSKKNLEAVEALGGTPYIPFKSNSVPVWKPDSAWARMYYRFMVDRSGFMANYHKRSNVESTFGAIKAKFDHRLRSRSPVGQINEAYFKVLCHNICTVIKESHVLGIDPTFCAEMPSAQKVIGD